MRETDLAVAHGGRAQADERVGVEVQLGARPRSPRGRPTPEICRPSMVSAITWP